MKPILRLVSSCVLLLATLLLQNGERLHAQVQEESQPKENGEVQEAGNLLKKVSETYRNLKDYRFQIHLLTVVQSDSFQKSLETDIDFSASRPHKNRLVMSGELGELQSFSDGATTWTFLPELKQYRRQTQSATKDTEQPAQDRASHLATLAREIANQPEKLSERVQSAQITGKETLMMEDKPVDCWVVQASPKAEEGGKQTSRTYWIDLARLLVLKAVQSTQIEASSEGGALKTQITTTLKQVQLNEPFSASWFSFDPPLDAKEVAQFRPPRSRGPEFIGKEASDFKLKDLKGTEVRLKDLRGQVVLLNFWASWCGPCRLEMPVIEKLHHEFKEEGLSVFGVNDEDFETVHEYLKEHEYTFPTLLDEEQNVARLYRIRGIPAMVVIDRDGTVSQYRMGLSRESELRAWLKQVGIQ